MTEQDLVYAAGARCKCGAGMAYPADASIDGAWSCSALLLSGGAADPTHSEGLPFAFYDVKAEIAASANGATTRPGGVALKRPPPPPRPTAQALFDAYNEQGPSPWKTFDGRDVPRWPALSDQVRAKWQAAAEKARQLAAAGLLLVLLVPCLALAADGAAPSTGSWLLNTLLSSPAVVLALTSGISAGLSWVLLHVGLWLKAHTKNETLLRVVDIGEAFAATVVQGLEQSLRPELAKPGTVMDLAGRARIKHAAVEGLRAALVNAAAPATKELLALGDAYLVHLVEQAVARMSAAQRAADLAAAAVTADP